MLILSVSLSWIIAFYRNQFEEIEREEYIGVILKKDLMMNKIRNTFLIAISLLVSVMHVAFAQEKKVAQTSKELYTEIAKMDSILFAAFNTQNMPVFKALFTEDLEWFQDNGGLLNYQTVFTNFGNMFNNEHKLSRKLVKSSLEVHPIKDYGAIEIGVHEFRHMENGKEELGTFKFMMIWQKKNGQWRISRVVSYDH